MTNMFTASSPSRRLAKSTILHTFVGIAKTTDKRELKERKEDYLSKKYNA